MKNLEHTVTKCRSILDDIQINYYEHVTVAVNNRLSRALGVCKRHRECCFSSAEPVYRYEIEINPVLLDERVSQTQLEETILHELLHTVNGCFCHTGKWLELANMVNGEYGYHIQRLAETNAAIKERREAKSPVKYICACESCGHEWKYKRWCSRTENPGRYIHTGCGGNLDLKRSERESNHRRAG